MRSNTNQNPSVSLNDNVDFMKTLETKRKWLKSFDKRIKKTYEKLKQGQDAAKYLFDIKDIGNLIYNSFERICCEAMKHQLISEFPQSELNLDGEALEIYTNILEIWSQVLTLFEELYFYMNKNKGSELLLSSFTNPKRLDKFLADILTASTVLKFLHREEFLRRIQFTFKIVRVMLRYLRQARQKIKRKDARTAEAIPEKRRPNSLWD